MASTVFLGNLPYDASEEELIAHFSQAGPVVSLRLVSDKETGKPKGFGFCEYRDHETALSAVRNLEDLPFKGRQLRINIADGQGHGDRSSTRATAAAASTAAATSEQLTQEQIASVVQGMTPEQHVDLLISARNYVGQQPQNAHELLVKNPQLAHALVQSMSRVNQMLTNPQSINM